MKTLFTIATLVFIFFSKISFGQISLEHVYDHAGTGVSSNQLMIVNFEDYGPHYVKVRRDIGEILIYDLNHILTKTIIVPNNLLPGIFANYVMYLSQKLFDSDDGIEYLLAVWDGSSGDQSTYIFDEDGTQLFYAPNQFPWVFAQTPPQQFPIYNTPQGTKMILSSTLYSDSSAYVYSLPSTLSTAIGEINNNYISDLSADKLFPNPTSSQANIELQLSNNDLPAILKVFDLSGNEINSYKIHLLKIQLLSARSNFRQEFITMT